MWKWVLTIVTLVALAAIGIYIETPKGVMEGSVALEIYNNKTRTNTFDTSNLATTSPRVVASGPVTRAAYVDAKGKFRIPGLPIGKYLIRVIANGYSSEYRSDIEIMESQVTKVKPVNLYFLEPSLNLSSDNKVFTSQEKPYFWTKVNGIKNINFKLYHFDPNGLIKSSNSKNSYFDFLLNNYFYGDKQVLSALIKDINPIKTWTREVNYGNEDTGSAALQIDNSLPKGAYILVAEGRFDSNKTDYFDAFWFTVSDIGFITKQDKNMLLIKSTNLLDLNEEPNLNLKVYDRDSSKLIGSMKTDKDGIAKFNLPKVLGDSNQSLIILGQKADNIAINGSYRWASTYSKYSVYLYTERPIYRPTQTVYFKGIIRENTDYGMNNLPGRSLVVNVYDPNNEPMKSFRFKTNKFGAYSGIFDIPANASLGSYTIETNYGNNQYTSNFEVAEYKKPEYKVEVVPGTPMIVGGNTTSATIKANYFFGYPVTNAKVKYTVYAKPDYSLRWELLPEPDHSPYFDDWEEDEDYSYDDSYAGSPIAEGYATTDENGEAKITFDTKKVEVDPNSFYSESESMPQEYKIEAEVTDISRKTAVGMNKFTVLLGDFALFMDTDSYIYSTDQDINLKINAVSFDKVPVSTKVAVQLQKWEWDEDTYQYRKPEIVSQTETLTDQNGKATLKIQVPRDSVSQQYRIVATAKDYNGNVISTTTYIWISNLERPSTTGESGPTLGITLDKKSYKPGDVAKVMIMSPVKNVKALLTIEADKIYSYQLIDIVNNGQIVQIPITKALEPNVYVSVCLAGHKKQFFSETKMIKVSPEENFLNVSVKADKKKYKPGDKITYFLKAIDANGHPVIADLSLGVVDESIYSLREDFTQDIRKFFFSKRDHNVVTSYSFNQSYSAGPDKIQPRLRKNFKDTAFWKADVITDKNGNAKVSFKLPDNLTTWRATVRAITANTMVGSAVDKALVTQDIIVRLSLPRFYTVGDRATLATIVHNYTDKPQNIKLELILPNNISINSSDKSANIFLNIPAADAVRKDWEIEAKVAGSAKLKAYALSSTIEGDALELPIQILPFGISKDDLASGIIQNPTESKDIDAKIVGKPVPGSIKWNISLAASNASSVLGTLDYLIDYPYGCTEQTMSKFLPSLVAKGVSKSLGIKLNPKSEIKLPIVVEQSLKRLYDNQHSDGGWGWWQYDDSSAYMTAYVLYGLKYAQDNNYAIDKNRLYNGTQWLKKYLTSKDVNSFIDKLKKLKSTSNYSYSYQEADFGYVNYVSTILGVQNNSLLNALYSVKTKLANVDLAYLALSFSELGQKAKASECLDLLLARTEISAPVIGFSSTQGLLTKLGISLPFMYFYSDVESTSVALQAMLKIRPNDPMAEKIANFILSSKDGDYWYNTKTTANVILAFSEYLKQQIETENPDYDLAVKLGDKVIKKLHIDRSSLFSPEMQLEIPTNLIGNTNKLTITKSGEGKLYYSSSFKYYQLFTASETIPATTNNGVSITKELFKVNSAIDKDGNLTYKENPVVGSVKAGDLLLVKLTVKVNKEGQYLLLEDPKASGMELVSSDPRAKLGNSYDDTTDEDNYYWWDFWWTNQEDRDTHMAFFMDKLLPGTYNVSYLIRPELPGKYLVRPAQITGMYSNTLSGSTSSMVLTVEK